MPMQTTGAISLQDLGIFFGRGGTRSLSMFYRGGDFVPDIPANSGIPTSGTIALSDFYGSVAQRTVSLTPSSQSANGTTSSHTFDLVTLTVSGGIPLSIDWSFEVLSGGTFTAQIVNGGYSAIPTVSDVIDSASGSIIATVTFVDEVKTAECFLSYLVAGGGGGLDP